MMKKLFVIALTSSMMLIGANASAQIVAGAGYVNSTTNSTYTSGSTTNKSSDSLNGAYVGASYNLPLNFHGLGLAPGVYYEFLTGKANLLDFGSIGTSDATTTEHFVNIPVLITYSYALQRDFVIGAYVGPNFQVGLASNTKVHTETILGSNDSTIDNYSDDNNYGRFNSQLAVGINFQIASLNVNVGYDLGLANLYTGDTDNYDMTRSGVRLGIGYSF